MQELLNSYPGIDWVRQYQHYNRFHRHWSNSRAYIVYCRSTANSLQDMSTWLETTHSNTIIHKFVADYGAIAGLVDAFLWEPVMLFLRTKSWSRGAATIKKTSHHWSEKCILRQI